MSNAVIAGTNMAVAREARLKRRTVTVEENGQLVDYQSVCCEHCGNWYNRQKILYLEPEDFENWKHPPIQDIPWNAEMVVGPMAALALLVTLGVIFLHPVWALAYIFLFPIWLMDAISRQEAKWDKEKEYKDNLLKKYGIENSKDAAIQGETILSIPDYLIKNKDKKPTEEKTR